MAGYLYFFLLCARPCHAQICIELLLACGSKRVVVIEMIMICLHDNVDLFLCKCWCNATWKRGDKANRKWAIICLSLLLFIYCYCNYLFSCNIQLQRANESLLFSDIICFCLFASLLGFFRAFCFDFRRLLLLCVTWYDFHCGYGRVSADTSIWCIKIRFLLQNEPIANWFISVIPLNLSLNPVIHEGVR